MSLDNTSGGGKDAVKEGNDSSGIVAKAMAEEGNQSARAQEQSRQSGRQEMQSVTGSDFQITDQSNGGKAC